MNLVANLTLVWIFAGPGLALGTSITATFQVLLAGWILTRRLGDFRLRSLLAVTFRTALATTTMTGACLAVSTLTPESALSSSFLQKLISLALPLGAGATAFLLTAKLTGLTEPFELLPGKRAK